MSARNDFRSMDSKGRNAVRGLALLGALERALVDLGIEFNSESLDDQLTDAAMESWSESGEFDDLEGFENVMGASRVIVRVGR